MREKEEKIVRKAEHDEVEERTYEQGTDRQTDGQDMTRQGDDR